MYKVNKRLKKAEAKRSENVLNPKILVEMAISQTPKEVLNWIHHFALKM